VALHDYPPDTTPEEAWPEDTWHEPSSRLDVTKLSPRFTERPYNCHTCRDTGYVQIGEAPGVHLSPCVDCVRGIGIRKAWEREHSPDSPA
jgi:hypothetical protein